MLNYRIRQIFYKPSHEGLVDPAFDGFFNLTLDKYFENSVIKKLYNEGDYEGHEYYGVVSWKFRNKTGYNGDAMEKLISITNHIGELYAFNKNFKKQNIWVVGENWHADFVKVGNAIFNRLGYDVDVSKLDTEPIYFNYWLIKNEWFQRYCKELLIPAMDLMDNDPEIIDMCERNANYTGIKVMKAQQCMQVFGKPYYTYYPFICERLMSTFAAIHGLNVVQI